MRVKGMQPCSISATASKREHLLTSNRDFLLLSMSCPSLYAGRVFPCAILVHNVTALSWNVLIVSIATRAHCYSPDHHRVPWRMQGAAHGEGAQHSRGWPAASTAFYEGVQCVPIHPAACQLSSLWQASWPPGEAFRPQASSRAPSLLLHSRHLHPGPELQHHWYTKPALQWLSRVGGAGLHKALYMHR